MTTQSATVVNELGLHLRAAARLVAVTGPATSQVRLSAHGVTVDGKSLLGITSLLASRGTLVTVEATGPDEAEVVRAAIELIEAGFLAPA
jgi:phosphotransferase system HPr (HPr) family protein